MKRRIHLKGVDHRNTLRLLFPYGNAPLTLSLAMTQIILHTHLVSFFTPEYIVIKPQLPLSPQVEQYRSKYALLRILVLRHNELLPLEGVICIYDKPPSYT